MFRFYRFKRSKGGKLLLPFIKTLNREYEKKFKTLFSSSIHRSIFLRSKDVFQINNYRDTHKSNYLCFKKKKRTTISRFPREKTLSRMRSFLCSEFEIIFSLEISRGKLVGKSFQPGYNILLFCFMYYNSYVILSSKNLITSRRL